MLEQLKEHVWKLHLMLPKSGLVVWTSGNISARDTETGLVVIKPSSDTASHLYIYRNRPDINGVVHTHSPYATAFAAVNRPIPVYLTAMADEFGGPIPCAGFALIGGEEIGKQVLEHIGNSPGVLLKNHGIFTVGATVTKAVQAAVMVEDIA